jgi:YebC/PmpR family DNA-binding regulatory protein
MSGHSKWATIKHKKAATDAKRGNLFTKLIREITVAAKNGGGDPSTNARLRTALERAKQSSMPQDNIDRAIKKGTGELEGITYEEFTIEGYGAGGVAIMVELLTDNKNRTTADIRNIFSKKNGNIAGAGSVSWMFQKKGYIEIDRKIEPDEDKVMGIVLDAGAQDMQTEEDIYTVTTDTRDLEVVKKTLENNKIKIKSAEITMIPSTAIKLEGETAKQVLGLVEALEEHDDVQNVYANFDIPDEILES